MPGIEIETDLVRSNVVEKTSVPIGVKIGGRRATELERLGVLNPLGTESGIVIEGEIVLGSVGLPIAE